MIRNPLQGGVGVNQMGGSRRAPRCKVCLLPIERGEFPSCLRKHFAGRIDAGHFGTGESIGEDAGQMTGAAAEVVNYLVIELGNARDEVDAGPKAYVGVAEVSLRLPSGHRSPRESYHRESAGR